MTPAKILFGLSGSIAIYKAMNAVSSLVKLGHEVQVVGTSSTRAFIGAATVEGLTGRPFLTDIVAEGHIMDHIHLARWCDVMVVAPATANTIARINLGLADDLLSSLVLALESSKKLLVVPAMNPQMWSNAKTQKHLVGLKDLPHLEILNPGQGPTACGEIGPGRMAEPVEIENKILALLRTKDTRASSRILITAGGTSEKIDAVRRLTNTSTGRTGVALAQMFSEKGSAVDLLLAQSAAPFAGSEAGEISTFESYDDLSALLKRKLEENSYAAVIHLAAVSDFSVENPVHGKLSSETDLTLKLKRNPKLLPKLKSWSRNPNIQVVGFKLTSTTEIAERESAAQKMFQLEGLDFLVANDTHEMDSPLNHIFQGYRKGKKVWSASNVIDLAQRLANEVTYDSLP
jgi:phosphopantothenoylcysteine decarboxylase / phosphopantothenate---cysteine ligase